jgi:1,4-alpha-glucan branching enzyme
MGEEIGAKTPFLFFCDFHGDLASAVREGRRKEFAAFPEFAAEEARARIPDPNSADAFLASKIDWDNANAGCLARFAALLALRREHIVPRLDDATRTAQFDATAPGGVMVDWTLADGARLHLRANFSAEGTPIESAPGTILHAEEAATAAWAPERHLDAGAAQTSSSRSSRCTESSPATRRLPQLAGDNRRRDERRAGPWA